MVLKEVNAFRLRIINRLEGNKLEPIDDRLIKSFLPTHENSINEHLFASVSEKKPKNTRRNWLKPDQLLALEKQFAQCMYIDKEDTAILADASNMSKDQIRIWFQNRRLRMRRTPKPQNQSTKRRSIFGNLPHLTTEPAQTATSTNVQIENCGNGNHSSSCYCSNNTNLNYNQPLTPLFQSYVGPVTENVGMYEEDSSPYDPSSDFMSNYEYDFLAIKTLGW